MDIFTNKRGICKWNSQNFNMSYSYTTFKDHHLLVIGSLGKIIIHNCDCASDPDCEVLNKNNPFQFDIYTNKRGTGK